MLGPRKFAAKAAGFDSRRIYHDAKKVVHKGSPALVAAVDSGKVSISAGATIATRPKPEQDKIIAQKEKEIVAASNAIKRKNKIEREQQRTNRLLLVPEKQEAPEVLALHLSLLGCLKDEIEAKLGFPLYHVTLRDLRREQARYP